MTSLDFGRRRAWTRGRDKQESTPPLRSQENPTTRMNMDMEPEQRPGLTARVRIEGGLEYDTVSEFFADVDSAFESAAGKPDLLVVDCAGLTFCDSSGLSALLMTLRRAHAQGTRLLLADRPPVLRDLMELTGTSSVFEDAQPVRADDVELAEGTTAMRSCAAVRRVDGHQVVELTGAIDLECADEVRLALDTAFAAAPPGEPRLIIDVTELEFADSTMLHLLMQARKQAEVHLAGPLAPGMRLLFEVAGVTELFPRHPSVPEAVLAAERNPQWKPVP